LSKVIDEVFGNVAFAPPANLYLGLATGPITAGGAITGEPAAASNYQRITLAQDQVNFPNATVAGSKMCPTSGNWTFNQANVAWGYVNVFFFSDQYTTNTNTWAWGNLNVNKNVGVGDTPYFFTNDVTLNIV
jgi:hypothetical protein